MSQSARARLMQTIRYVTSTADDGVEEEEGGLDGGGVGLGDGVYGTRFDVRLCGVVECVVGIAFFLFRLMEGRGGGFLRK